MDRTSPTQWEPSAPSWTPWRRLITGAARWNWAIPYQVSIATIISQRTREEQTTAVSERVFARYPDVPALASRRRSRTLRPASRQRVPRRKSPAPDCPGRYPWSRRYNGQVPDDLDALLSLPGVGRKTANCVLIYAFQKAALCVDIHCHRITNRLGWVSTKTPDQTEKALEKVMPRDLWAGSNRLFLQHGRALCLPTTPICSRCPVRQWCAYGQDARTKKR